MAACRCSWTVIDADATRSETGLLHEPRVGVREPRPEEPWEPVYSANAATLRTGHPGHDRARGARAGRAHGLGERQVALRRAGGPGLRHEDRPVRAGGHNSLPDRPSARLRGQRRVRIAPDLGGTAFRHRAARDARRHDVHGRQGQVGGLAGAHSSRSHRRDLRGHRGSGDHRPACPRGLRAAGIQPGQGIGRSPSHRPDRAAMPAADAVLGRDPLHARPQPGLQSHPGRAGSADAGADAPPRGRDPAPSARRGRGLPHCQRCRRRGRRLRSDPPGSASGGIWRPGCHRLRVHELRDPAVPAERHELLQLQGRRPAA